MHYHIAAQGPASEVRHDIEQNTMRPVQMRVTTAQGDRMRTVYDREAAYQEHATAVRPFLDQLLAALATFAPDAEVSCSVQTRDFQAQRRRDGVLEAGIETAYALSVTVREVRAVGDAEVTTFLERDLPPAEQTPMEG